MIETLFVLGAGFSHNAGLPLQRDFTDAILKGRDLQKPGPSRTLTRFLGAFVADIFGHADNSKIWPELEDLFTCVDLAANTGHHLGQFSPADLRTVRRALISRIIRMLRQRYKPSGRKPGPDPLSDLVMAIDYRNSAFVVLNWDTVLEDRLSELKPEIRICHGNGIEMVGLDGLARPEKGAHSSLQVIKMHGSINWLYCDGCRRTFAFPPAQSSQIAAQLLRKEDWARIDRTLKKHNLEGDLFDSRTRAPLLCTRCRGVELGTRLATFSYRKALEFPMFQHSWYSAEELLRTSNRWVFVGYSLPAADFEFKHLLKRVEISRPIPPTITVVTGSNGPSPTHTNYERFFGSKLKTVAPISDVPGLL